MLVKIVSYKIDFQQFKNRKILITGGLGFVGVNFYLLLKEHSIEPIIIDYHDTIENSIQDYIPFNLDDINYYNVNLVNRKDVLNKISEINPDFIIHLASNTSLQKDYEMALAAIDSNIKGTIHLLEAIKRTPVEGFVFLSTSDVYGGCEPPFKEDQKILPASPYSITKASAEYFCQLFHKIDELPITILRSFNVFGPYQKTNRFIPFIITKLLKGEEIELTIGEQKREFNYIDNLLDAIMIALTNETGRGKVINIGSGKSISIKELALQIADLFNSRSKLKFGAIPYRPNEIFDMYSDNSLAKEILNWSPKIDFNDGLRKTIDWYEKF
ncbi:MAG: NAD-dependent epimerase/dehydratase family protein [Asgard group archaeon]|nr:NAD-dependent epimerase/dehydratase family protein [Asgard group archaeon]